MLKIYLRVKKVSDEEVTSINIKLKGELSMKMSNCQSM